jgi:hypothetical protein
MTVYHFVIALVLAVTIVPKSPATLNDLNNKIVRKHDIQPIYILKMDEQHFKLDQDEKRLISSKWIEEMDIVEPGSLPEDFVQEDDLVFLVKLKKRKEDKFRLALQDESLELKHLEASNITYQEY